MNHSLGASASMSLIRCWFTASHTLAYSVTGMSQPVASSLRLWRPSAATLYVVQSGDAQMTSGRPPHSSRASETPKHPMSAWLSAAKSSQ
ncbi:hypothetical protein [Collinsella intestinalis]|uniref:hypothetical protein n=1 Tax=Collinsella intestinalis TaxID=147207 RepID=UPI0025A461C4|nr:hypothetical protein [Collinsella intestinalis]MDM8162450.1 hypothetical protein [Collinsella intestinalis]